MNDYISLYGGRAKAFDDSQKEKKIGIYRTRYEDKNDLDKNGKPKIKFNYYYIHNNKPVSKKDQERINKLGLAPAYNDVWISESADTKIQATGIDIKGKKQYRYKQDHIETSTKDKFLRLYKFIKAIQKLYTAMNEDLKKPLYRKERTITVILGLIKELNLRVGKEVYAQKNKSYGATSLKKNHIKFEQKDDGKLVAKFNFKAKSNKIVQYTLDNTILVNELIELIKLDGEKLFQYKKGDVVLRVTDVDLNHYIQEHMGKMFTAKDFRTFAANYYFIKSLLKETRNRSPDTQKIAKKNLSLAQNNTAFYLRHTKSISKKSYTMDLIREMYMSDPNYFIKNKFKQPLTVLTEMLKMFKDSNN